MKLLKLLKDKRGLSNTVLGGIIGSIVLIAAIGATVYFTSQSDQITINGAGATFPFPLISRWIDEYKDIQPNVVINYNSIGSGGGIKQIQAKTVDFGASDAPLSSEEFESMPGILHIPETIGAVTLAYNLDGVADGLRLNQTVIADIFLGKITKWNDISISQLNPGVSLPDKEIAVIHRSDGSGTTFVWTDYLSAISDEWKENVGKGKSVEWPTGQGAKGNEGVTAVIEQTPGAIGYIELSYAITNSLKTVAFKNKNGDFVQASTETIQAAVENAVATLPKGDESWENVTIVDAPGKNSFPVASLTYILIYKDLNNVDNKEEAQALVDFLWWIIHDGQQFADPLYYVALPSALVSLNEDTLKLVNFQGTTLSLPSQ